MKYDIELEIKLTAPQGSSYRLEIWEWDNPYNKRKVTHFDGLTASQQIITHTLSQTTPGGPTQSDIGLEFRLTDDAGTPLKSSITLQRDGVTIDSLGDVASNWIPPEARNVYPSKNLPDKLQIHIQTDGEPIVGKPDEQLPTALHYVPEVAVSLQRTTEEETPDRCLWESIENRSQAIGFQAYAKFLNNLLCGSDNDQQEVKNTLGLDGKLEPHNYQDLRSVAKNLLHFGTHAYDLVRDATELFLLHECGTAGFSECRPDETEGADDIREKYLVDLQDGFSTIPYFALIREKLADIPMKPMLAINNGGDGKGACYGILPNRFSSPCLIELIWSFWFEVMGFKQAMNLLSLRYQNRRVPGKDPLSRLELDPLRPLNNLLWGYVQNSSKHLTIARRAAEYMHAYGLPLRGKAIPNMIHADTRKRFLRSFHTLLNLSAEFFRQDDDTTIYADGFPLLNALRELHVILAEGYHNQAQDLTWTARAETMIEQWMLTLPPMRDFLGGRVMVPYAEPWMDRIDTMKKYMGWSEVSASQFHELATFGEQILLSVRFGNWSKINDPVYASNWAKYWRAPLQRYISNYQSVTGVDLSRPGKVDATPPSDLIARSMRQGLDMAS